MPCLIRILEAVPLNLEPRYVLQPLLLLFNNALEVLDSIVCQDNAMRDIQLERKSFNVYYLPVIFLIIGKSKSIN